MKTAPRVRIATANRRSVARVTPGSPPTSQSLKSAPRGLAKLERRVAQRIAEIRDRLAHRWQLDRHPTENDRFADAGIDHTMIPPEAQP